MYSRLSREFVVAKEKAPGKGKIQKADDTVDQEFQNLKELIDMQSDGSSTPRRRQAAD